ncbi:hypothetical protein [Paraburkholderia youngii]|uniref:hypothetical protein n=1 Tax=Paraburkholderia youngii TaxID=2782701 RepID=UPI003D19BFE0
MAEADGRAVFLQRGRFLMQPFPSLRGALQTLSVQWRVNMADVDYLIWRKRSFPYRMRLFENCI